MDLPKKIDLCGTAKEKDAPDGGSSSTTDGVEKTDDKEKEGEGDDIGDEETSINRNLQQE